MSVSSIGDLETEAAPPKKSGGFSDAAGKIGGFGVAGGGQMAMITKSLVKMGGTRANLGSVSEADMPAAWESIASDLDLCIDSEYATGSGELMVEYPTGIRVRMGQKMKIADVRNVPSRIKCSALAASGNSDDLYLLMFINPDVPSMAKPLQRSWLHWMIVNVKGFQTESGRILCKYTPPTPSANSGLHRYIFFLFKQEEHLDQVAAYEDARRGKFSVSEFAKRYHLGKPVAMTFFQSERPGSRKY